ncbi:MAG: VCBS repeat-containing protein [Mucilaginibacter sp.]
MIAVGTAGVIILIRFWINDSQPAKGWHPVVQKINVKHAPFSVEMADLNGDKIKDIVIANCEDSSVTILTGTGKGNFARRADPPSLPVTPQNRKVSCRNSHI